MPVPGADQAKVLLSCDPFERSDVVEGRLRHRRLRDLEVIEALGDRKSGRLEAVAEVGLVARRDLSLDEGTQDLLGRPALRLGGVQNLGRELAERPQLEALECLREIG